MLPLRLTLGPFLLLALSLPGAGLAPLSAAPPQAQPARRPAPAAPTAQGAGILLGIDVLQQQGFAPLLGQRVGLLTHPAGVNRRGVPTVEVLRADSRVNLVALFGPEHGIYGDEAASVPVEDRIDARTGLPVFSLYGKFRKPTPAMLARIDLLVIDLQDIGVRSYTYVSCMRYALEACFENNVAVLVLDRPNPLGGLKVDGPPMDDAWMSYVGAFRVPYVHGLTIGELARMAQALPGWLPLDEETRRRGRLTVVPMQGWRRSLLWTSTGLAWVPTSPNIPDLSAVLGYAITGLGQQNSGFTHGIGTPYPFRLLRHPRREPEQLLADLSGLTLPGLSFRLVDTQTKAGRPIRGVYVIVDDWSALRPTELSFHLMRLGASWDSQGNPYARLKPSERELFNKHVGSSAWWQEISTRGASARPALFLAEWTTRARAFQEQARPYWLYPP